MTSGKTPLLAACAAIALLTSSQTRPSAVAVADSWQNLFDGKTLTGWHRLAGTAEYTVENGAIVGTAVLHLGNTFLVTEKEYGDFVLKLDVKVDSPLSNSGIQMRSHFDAPAQPGKVYGRQVEIDPSVRSWLGGIYDEARRE